ncbi:MAG: chemotaxis protein [Proteobacteria bacterium]|nr:chemotaxis protein [Pseudomonadota bacterium]
MVQAEAKQKILLESGTNEVEILEFFLGGQSYGINVSKILQIITYDEEFFTQTPETPPAMPGVLLWRNETIPFINLYTTLNIHSKVEVERPVALVTEFNNLICAFLIDGVNRIHRISWDKMDSMDPFLDQFSAKVTGSVHVDDKDVLLIDFEYIVAELFPATKLGYGDAIILPENVTKEMRGSRKIVLAEDSPFIRHAILELMHKAGYSTVSEFENGQIAYDHLMDLKQTITDESVDATDHLDLIITDIEMPRLDGLTLCRRIKDDTVLGQTPVIIFSSLINEQMGIKCQEVGSDAHITKPQMGILVDTLDKLLFGK